MFATRVAEAIAIRGDLLVGDVAAGIEDRTLAEMVVRVPLDCISTSVDQGSDAPLAIAGDS